MIWRNAYNSLGEFNRLDARPIPLLPEQPTQSDLTAAFAFLFKPNRVLALHPNNKHTDADPGWPSEDGDKHWMMKIQTPKSLCMPTCLLTLSQYGLLSLWCYQNKSESGIHPLNLAHHQDNTDNNLLLQDQHQHSCEPDKITLIRITQNTDEDSLLHNIRIETTHSIFTIELHIASLVDQNNVQHAPTPYLFARHARPQTTHASPGCHQIGGWGGGKPFHWEHATHQLIEGNPARPTAKHPFPFHVRAAEKDENSFVVGGECTQIWAQSKLKEPACHLRSHLYALAIVPDESGSEPFVLAGCDDHNLYILDWRGNVKQKAMMGGIVEGILLLDRSEAWIDVAIRVRNKGLYCARLFIDCLQQHSPFANDREHFRNAVANLLTPNPTPILKQWFNDPKHQQQQMLALTVLLSHPVNPKIANFFNKKNTLKYIQYPVIEFWVHILHRAILQCISQPAEWRQADLLRYLRLLTNIANGPERARLAIRKLEGWLLTLLTNETWPEELHQHIDRLHALLPDAKRLLRQLALQINQTHDEKTLNQCLSMYVSTYNRIGFDRCFTELILGGVEKTGPVAAVAMIGAMGKGKVALVRVHRDDAQLRAFYLDASDTTIKPRVDKDHWRHALHQTDQSMQPVQCLLPLDDSRLLIIAEYSIGIAVKGELQVRWLDKRFSCPLRSAAITGQSEALTIAVGSVCNPQSEHCALVYLFAVNEWRLTAKAHLFPTDDVQPQSAIHGLAWDAQGDLWGVTSTHGLLLHWSGPLAQDSKLNIIKKLNAGQRTLTICQGLIICGGEDAVVRAFQPSGALAWNFITRGPVQQLRSLSEDQQLQADQPIVAVISEQEHLYTLNAQGQQCALLFMPNQHLLSLSVRVLRPDGQMHFFIGVLEGEVRLIETSTQQWSHTSYSNISDNSVESKAAWPAIKTLLQKKIHLLHHPEKLQEWCSPGAATQEPMRCVWAAGQLIEQFNDIDSVLTMLEEFNGEFAPDIVKLRAHSFALLAPKLDDLTQSQQARVKQLSKNARDGAFASLIMRLPQKDERGFSFLLPILIEKVVSGAPFTSAALLHVLRNDGWRKPLETILIELMAQTSLASLHRGLLSGLLSIFFQQSRTVAHTELISALANIGGIFPMISTHLLVAKHHRRFCQWLDQYGPRIFSLEDQATWIILSPYLSTTDPLKLSLQEFIRIVGCRHPNGDESQRLCDMIDHIKRNSNLLPNAWRTWQLLGKALSKKQNKILHDQLTAVKIRQEIEDAKALLRAYKPDIPLFFPLQSAWKSFMEKSVDDLEKKHLTQHKPDYLKLSHDTFWVVDDEPAPLTLRITNQGPEDLAEPICFGLGNTSIPYIKRNTPSQVTCEYLACPNQAPLGEALELQIFLLPPFAQIISLEIFWTVGKATLNETLSIKCVPRWTKYRASFPTQDKLAYDLFAVKTKEAFKYNRVIIKRTPYAETAFVDRQTLTDIVYDWADRTGRRKDLNLLSPEMSWPGAESFAKYDWQERLQEKPLGLEVWLVDQSIGWSLRFLNALVNAKNTALLLPDLVVEDADKPTEMFRLLDNLLHLHEDNQLNTLQWALKACTQSVRDVSAQVTTSMPTILGRAVLQGKQRLSRGETPSVQAWQTMHNGVWPIAGVASPRDAAALPPDPAKPLSVLVSADAFKILFRMGLIRHWQHWWTPRSKVLLDYVDGIYPTKKIGDSQKNAKEGSPWRWSETGWSKQEVEYARNVLFGKRHREPIFPPYEGFSFNEWHALRDYAKTQPLPDAFFTLIGLENRATYQQILLNQPTWSKLLTGDAAAHASFLTRLENDHITTTEHRLPPTTAYRLIWLTIEGQINRFHKMLLILPKEDYFHKWETGDKTRSVLRLMKRITNQVKIGDAILLMVTECPAERDHAGALSQQEVVFLNTRHINRLMVCRSPAQTLVSIAKSQVSLSSLAQGIFQTNGPVAPSRFFGRTSELEQLTGGLLAGKSFVITGPRSIGKSSLLQFFPKSSYWEARLKGKYFLISMDLQDQRTGLNYGNFLYRLLTTHPNPSEKLMTAVNAIRKRLTPTSVAENQTWMHNVTDLFEQVFEAIERYAQDRRPIFLLDEADGFYQYDKKAQEPFFTLFRKYHAEGRAQFIFASYPEKADSMAEEILYSGNQSFNFLETINLDTLKTYEAQQLVQSGMKEIGVECNTQQCKWVVANTFSIPSLTQQTCLNICLALEQQIAEEEVDELQQSLLDRVIRKSQQHFLDIFFAQLRPKAVKFALFGLVLDGKNSFTVQEAGEAFSSYADINAEQDQIEGHLQTLLRTLILTYRSGKYFFTGGNRPYFPTMIDNVYGKNDLEDEILHLMSL